MIVPLYFILRSVFMTVGYAEGRLHLGNTQINLVLRLIYTTFAQKFKSL